MEEYPFLNEAVASVLRTQREEHDLSKKRLSELAKIERAYITSLERGEKRPTLNVLFSQRCFRPAAVRFGQADRGGAQEARGGIREHE